MRMMGPYVVGPTLGEGGFSKVKLGTHQTTGEKVALKLLKCMNDSSKKQVEAELMAMSKIEHQHVIRLKHVDWNARYQKKNGKAVELVLVVLELATGGELFEFLQHTGSFEEAIARTYFHQLVEGLSYCHSQNVAHRDLKPENLLLDQAFVLKLADFGFARIADTSKSMFTQCGTQGYMGPEMFENQGYDGKKVDVWACGVILFIMFAGFPPFQVPKVSDWWFQKLKSNRHDLFWRAHCRTVYFSDGFKDLINKILCPDPNTRINLEDIKKHDWYNGEVISVDTLNHEMARRSEKVVFNKERDRMAKKQVESGSAGSGDTVYRSLEGDTHYRSLDDYPDAPPAMDLFLHAAVAEMGDMGLTGFGDGSDSRGVAAAFDPARAAAVYTRFQSHNEAHELFNMLVAVARASGADYIPKPQSYKLKLTATSDLGPVTIAAQVFRDASGTSHHVEFRRLNGGGIPFRSMYHLFREQMADMVLSPEGH